MTGWYTDEETEKSDSKLIELKGKQLDLQKIALEIQKLTLESNPATTKLILIKKYYDFCFAVPIPVTTDDIRRYGDIFTFFEIDAKDFIKEYGALLKKKDREKILNYFNPLRDAIIIKIKDELGKLSQMQRKQSEGLTNEYEYDDLSMDSMIKKFGFEK